MATETRDIQLSYKADIAQLLADLKSIPGMTEKQAKEMVRALDRNLVKAEKAAKKAATGSRKEWKQFEQQIDKATDAAKEFADQTGDTDSILAGLAGTLDLINPALGDAVRVTADLAGGAEAVGKSVFKISPIFVALGAVVAVAAGAFMHFKGKAKDAEEATEKAAKEAEIAEKVYRGLAKAIQKTADEWAVYTGVLSDLDVKQAAAERRITTQFTPALDLHKTKMAELGEELAGLVSLEGQRAKSMKETLASVAGTNEAEAALREEIEKHAAAVSKLTTEQNTLIHQSQVLVTEKEFERIETERLKDSETAAKDATADRQKAALATAKAVQEALQREDAALVAIATTEAKRIAAQEALAGIVAKAGLDQLDGAARILAARDDEIAKIKALSLAENELAGVEAATDSVRERAIRDLIALQAEQGREALESLRATTAATAAELTAQKALYTEATVDMFGNASEAFGTFADMTADIQGDTSLKLFRIAQGSAIAEITINTATAITKALAQLGPVAGTAAGAAITAAGLAQAAIVLAESPPSLEAHAGLAPDVRNAALLQGEGVLSKQGVAAAGGAQAVRNLNTGGGGGSAIVVQNVYRHRVFDSFVQDNIRRSGPLRSAIKKAGGPVGHR